jgi:hypothetical protein
MSRRDVSVTLRQMLDYSQKAVNLSRGRTRSDLDKYLTFNLALTRLVEMKLSVRRLIVFQEVFRRSILKLHGRRS